jgi:hypothetical protein
VDLATWCPPTFVGNSGIECSNGHRGFALQFDNVVMAGLVPAIHVFTLGERRKTWMPGTRPGMTVCGIKLHVSRSVKR